MRWPRANLEEKQEPRAATSASAERRAEGISHDVTRKGLTEAAIEKPTFHGFYECQIIALQVVRGMLQRYYSQYASRAVVSREKMER
jgi:hypothetical protein